MNFDGIISDEDLVWESAFEGARGVRTVRCWVKLGGWYLRGSELTPRTGMSTRWEGEEEAEGETLVGEYVGRLRGSIGWRLVRVEAASVAGLSSQPLY